MSLSGVPLALLYHFRSLRAILYTSLIVTVLEFAQLIGSKVKIFPNFKHPHNSDYTSRSKRHGKVKSGVHGRVNRGWVHHSCVPNLALIGDGGWNAGAPQFQNLVKIALSDVFTARRATLC